MILYVAVVKVNREYAGSHEPLEAAEVKHCLDCIINLALGFRGKIIGSELVEGDKSSCDIPTTPVKVRY